MVSNTSRTRAKRRRKASNAGKENKKQRVKEGTPKFPLRPEAQPQPKQ